jgi:PPK2 family polyphosphate:nucleotide phosphotransferase
MQELALRIAPGQKVDLKAVDPSETLGIDKDDAKDLLEKQQEKLQDLQQCLYAQGKHALLIVLQAMDCAGKDGTIRHVLGAFDPQGVQVTPFKVPTPEELAHDFLWRVHRAVPQRSQVGIFNRSHYEDVLVVRVKGFQPEAVWRRHYEHINHFEKLLTDSGVTIVKIFLHISPEEQAERLRERQTQPDKQWKFSPGDLEDRKLWPAYREAYEEAFRRCSTEWAPWHIVPANKKWFRNLAVSDLLIRTLEGLELRYPDPIPEIESYVIPSIE